MKAGLRRLVSWTSLCGLMLGVAGGRALAADDREPEVSITSPARVAGDEASRAASRGDVLLGLTFNGSPNSALVSVDPISGAILQTHLLLDPREYFIGIAYDSRHHKVWVVSQGDHNLYSIDTRTLAVKHVGNLRIDTQLDVYSDAGALAYDPVTDTLYTAIQYRTPTSPSNLPIWTDLAKVDRTTAGVEVVGRIDGASISSLAFDESTASLYGLALYGFSNDLSTQVVRIDPATASAEIVLYTHVRNIIGLAYKPPATFFNWINDTMHPGGHGYSRIDLDTGSISPLGSTEGTDSIIAMTYRDFPVRAKAAPLPDAPVSFAYSGVIDSVDDRAGVLGGRIVPGDPFSGEFSYDASSPWRRRNPNGHAPYGLSVTFDGTDYAIEGVNASVLNNFYYNTPRERIVLDQFLLKSDIDDLITVQWTLEDSTTQAISRNDRLPKQFSLSKWAVNRFEISIFSPEGHRLYTLTGHIERIKRQRGRPGS